MIALAYYSPPTRQPIDAAESAHRESAAGFLSSPSGCPAASSIAPVPQPVERHGAGGVPAHTPPAPTILDRLWARTEISATGCWIWTGSTSCGYGQIQIDRRNYRAHRVGYELLIGPIPEGLQIDHLCRVRRCWNPDHLEPVTIRENVLRGEGITARAARQTHCIHGHELTPENIASRPGDPRRRDCLTCANERARRYRAAKRGAES